MKYEIEVWVYRDSDYGFSTTKKELYIEEAENSVSAVTNITYKLDLLIKSKGTHYSVKKVTPIE